VNFIFYSRSKIYLYIRRKSPIRLRGLQKGNTLELKKKIALIAAGSLISTGALFAVVNSANAADTTTAPAATSPAADSGYMDANEANDPADANEANEAPEANEADEANEAPEANEADEANEGPEDSSK
jgi:hypothetical protein